MPILSKFYGITILMHFQENEHNPPHFHAVYNDYDAIISISDGKILDGYMPNKAYYLIKEWLNEHSCELLDVWNSQVFKKISPLD